MGGPSRPFSAAAFLILRTMPGVMIAATNGGHGRAVRGGIRRVCGISSSPVRLLVPGGGWLSGQDSGTVYIRPENGLTTSDMAGVRLTTDCRSALSS